MIVCKYDKDILLGIKQLNIYFFSVSSAHIHALQVCEIVAVHTKDDDQDNKETRRSRAEAKQTSQLHPHAFTGIKPTLIYTLKGIFHT